MRRPTVTVTDALDDWPELEGECRSLAAGTYPFFRSDRRPIEAEGRSEPEELCSVLQPIEGTGRRPVAGRRRSLSGRRLRAGQPPSLTDTLRRAGPGRTHCTRSFTIVFVSEYNSEPSPFLSPGPSRCILRSCVIPADLAVADSPLFARRHPASVQRRGQSPVGGTIPSTPVTTVR